jgi:hypothetical protein
LGVQSPGPISLPEDDDDDGGKNCGAYATANTMKRLQIPGHVTTSLLFMYVLEAFTIEFAIKPRSVLERFYYTHKMLIIAPYRDEDTCQKGQ